MIVRTALLFLLFSPASLVISAQEESQDEEGYLSELLSETQRFDVVLPDALTAALPRPERNPFLLVVEQQRGQRIADVRANERTQQAVHAGGLDPFEYGMDVAARRARLASMRVSAVLVASDGTGSALIDGRFMRIGDAVPGTDAVLATIDRQGVTVILGTDEIRVTLPPPRLNAAPAQASPDTDNGSDAGMSAAVGPDEAEEMP